MTISQLSKRMDSILAEIPDKSFDKYCILEDMGRITREQCLIHPDTEISDSLSMRIISAANRRASGYPLQYILGKWEFYGRSFKVGEGVLIPRPDTEVLVDEALKRLSDGKKHTVIDLCSGSGCIAVTLAKELEGRAKVYAAELSGEAFAYLAENVKLNNADVRLIRGDVMDEALTENFRDFHDRGKYIKIDCIVSNPPYLTDEEMDSLQREVSFEPETALYGGTDGLRFYGAIAKLWSELLIPGGLMIFEIGNGQEQAVSQILSDCGFDDIFTAKDAAGTIRVVGGRKC